MVETINIPIKDEDINVLKPGSRRLPLKAFYTLRHFILSKLYGPTLEPTIKQRLLDRSSYTAINAAMVSYQACGML